MNEPFLKRSSLPSNFVFTLFKGRSNFFSSHKHSDRPFVSNVARTSRAIMNVDISDGGIQGEVPTWFWNLSSQIVFSIFVTINLLVRFQSSQHLRG
ncbi:hypothetical protein H5410_000972 [Solanum commersonii]|uniref:Uncharacterized protein n=1 Tax=Solanum commersonii TaxID=4109 RepID=A0A9J6AYT1_SOLCO|nr:hypothetical protein H5410_000972 [Solanum commersonii]